MRFWTSDTHFGHSAILRYCQRPWYDVESMNRGLISRWNDTVSDDDIVIILGDFAMGKISDSLSIAERLNGKKYIVPGNHDRMWQGNRDPEKWVQKYEDVGFHILPSVSLANIGGYTVKVCHFPYDMHDERYSDFHPKDEGDVILHGHVHDTWRVKGRQINVGVDAWAWRPISDDEITPILERMNHE